MIWLERYAKRGFKLFPVEAKSKKPLISDNLKKASSDIEVIRAWSKRWPGCNWGLSLAASGLVCVDVDKAGVSVWAGLTTHNGEPETLTQASGSGVGNHYIFKAREGARYRGVIAAPSGNVEGIDIKWNGYILLEPSRHPKGGLYRWDGNGFDAEIADVPDWLARLIEKPEVKPREKKPLSSVNAQQYKALIVKMKEKPLSYQQWVQCGQALHSEFSGSDDGLHLWLELTHGKSYVEGDEERAVDKWGGFNPEGGLGIGSLYHVAKEIGADIPNPALAVDKVAFARTQYEKARAEEGAGWFQNSKTNTVTVKESLCIDWFNNAGYCLVGGGDLYKKGQEDGVPSVRPIPDLAFVRATDHLFLKEYDENGKEHMSKARVIWQQSSQKQQYSRICFRPNASPDELNLWAPIPTKRRPGPIDDIRSLIVDIVCNGEEDRAEYLLDWMAHVVQKPAEKCPVVPVLIGDQGTGKGLVTDGLLAGILGPFYLRIDQPGMLMQQFNIVQARRFCTVLDEASWKGHHNLSNLLKSLTGSPTMLVEEKFGPQYTIENFSRYLVTSNSKEAVKIEMTNRRHLTFDMAPPAAPEFYSKLWDEIINGHKCEAFYDFLMSRSLLKFNPFKFPAHLDTNGDETKMRSMGSIGQFWAQILLEEPQRLWKKTKVGSVEKYCLHGASVFKAFEEWCGGKNGRQATSLMRFWAESQWIMEILGYGVVVRTGGVRQKIFVCTPSELRHCFCQKNRLNVPYATPLDSDYHQLDVRTLEDF